VSADSAQRHVPVRDLVVIGASAGGVEALKDVVGRLPADLAAAVCVVLHIAPTGSSALAGILQRAGPLPCRAALDGDELEHGHILVAPPDRHLVVDDGRVRLSAGPRENGHRPSVDVLFRSAARARESAVIGVVLSGTRDDGTSGLAVIKQRGGAAVVQDPEEALYSGMPSSAIAHVSVDAIAPTTLIADTIVALVHGADLPSGVRASIPAADDSEPEDDLTLVCPECGGVLTERDEAGMQAWGCHVGHRYSPRSLVGAQGGAVEAALWTALRSLEDRAALLGRMASQASLRAQKRSAQLFRVQAREAKSQADLIRAVVEEAAAAAQRDRAADAPVEVGEVA
jgi:two-component system, chemotaxis family, protein-glutamate methylesterase/glutaminase